MVTGTKVHNGGAALILRKDGTLTGRRLPTFFGEASEPTPPNGSGTWHICRLGSDSPACVALEVAPSFRVQDEFLIENCCHPLAIYYDKGDPDEAITGQYQLTSQPSRTSPRPELPHPRANPMALNGHPNAGAVRDHESRFL